VTQNFKQALLAV